MTDRVRLRLKGRFPERFVEEALRAGIRFEKIERTGVREAVLTTGTSDARRVGDLAGQYGLELTLESRVGWRVTAEALLARGTLFFGLLLAMALVVLFSSRVWVIDLVAADEPLPAETEERMADALAGLGVTRAMSRLDVDSGLISASLLGEFPQLTYAGVRLHGVCLTVEYKTEDAAPPVYQPDDARDLVAARDAVIVSVEPLAGKACVQPGDTVRAGQLLIRGEEKTGAEETRRIRAMGQVTARVWFASRSSAPLQQTVRTRTGRTATSSVLRLLDWSVPLVESEGFSCQDVERDYLPVGGLYVPVMIERCVMHEVSQSTAPLDRAALEAELTGRAFEDALSQLPRDAQEYARWTKTSEKDGVLSVEAVIEARMDIAAEH